MSNDLSTSADKRVVRSKSRILKETYRLLTEEGLNGVSVDEISRRSGVAKTTIYRHWSTRAELLIDACSTIGAPQAPPDTGTLKGDVMLLAQTVADQLNTAAWPSVLPSIIDSAERDPDIAQLLAKLHAGNMQPFFQAIERARDRGELDQERDPETLVAQLMGPLFYRRWFSKELIDEAFVSQILEKALQ